MYHQMDLLTEQRGDKTQNINANSTADRLKKKAPHFAGSPRRHIDGIREWIEVWNV